MGGGGGGDQGGRGGAVGHRPLCLAGSSVCVCGGGWLNYMVRKNIL